MRYHREFLGDIPAGKMNRNIGFEEVREWI
jgi:hypothetical protein